MLKLVWFVRSDAKPGNPAKDDTHIHRHLSIDQLEGDEERGVLRETANALFGPECQCWRFYPDHLPRRADTTEARAIHSRLNKQDKGPGRPATVVAYQIDPEGRPVLGNYLAIRYYA